MIFVVTMSVPLVLRNPLRLYRSEYVFQMWNHKSDYQILSKSNHKNIVTHTARTIVSWPNPKHITCWQLQLLHYTDLFPWTHANHSNSKLSCPPDCIFPFTHGAWLVATERLPIVCIDYRQWRITRIMGADWRNHKVQDVSNFINICRTMSIQV